MFHHIYNHVVSAIPLFVKQNYWLCSQRAVKEQGEGLGCQGSEEGAAREVGSSELPLAACPLSPQILQEAEGDLRALSPPTALTSL